MAKGKAKPELNLWGEPMEEHQRPRPDSIPLDFEGRDIRMFHIGEMPWWVAADVCRALEVGNAPMALTRLDDDEKGISTIDTPGGPQEMAVVNEAGLFNLILTSRKDEAKRFKRWLTHEVLPALRKTGTYSLAGSPVRRVSKRLRCDAITAAHRLENVDVNKHAHGRLKSQKATPNHFKGYHNGRYSGLYGDDAKGLRRALDIKGRRSPLDRMGLLVVIQNSYATAMAERLIEERSIPLDEQAAFVERLAREIAASDAARMGENFIVGVRDDPRRGKILDFVPRSLTTAG